MTARQVRADHDDEGLYVYQAYRPEIGHYALANQRFGGPFRMDRMTWIKPSFAWMLYRSGYGDKPGQEFMLRIKITHDGFRTMLGDAVLSHYVPSIHGTEADFQRAKMNSDCRVQWDPERDLRLHAQPIRAIQVGIKGSLVDSYIDDWILSIDDATPLAHAVRDAVRTGGPLPTVPVEKPYPVSSQVRRRLNIDATG
jgi:hypothetical protein